MQPVGLVTQQLPRAAGASRPAMFRSKPRAYRKSRARSTRIRWNGTGLDPGQPQRREDSSREVDYRRRAEVSDPEFSRNKVTGLGHPVLAKSYRREPLVDPRASQFQESADRRGILRRSADRDFLCTRTEAAKDVRAALRSSVGRSEEH